LNKNEKKLGVFSLTALVTGNMVGSGIFLLPSTMARLGSLSLVSWIFTTIGSLFLAFVFSRLSMLFPKTGGPYAYVQAGLGNALGFQTAYCYWINVWVGNAAIALAGIGYLSIFFPAFATPWNACIATIASVWIFTFINLRGIQTAGIVQLVTTILKLIPIFFVGLFGWIFFQIENITESLNVSSPQITNFDVITQGATLTLWAFIGLESATVPASSVENPKRTIPLATIIGTSIAAVAYIVCSIVIMGIIPNEVLQNSLSPFADVAEIMVGDWGKWVIAAGAVVSCFGALNGWTLIQGQIPMAAADDHLFMKIFSRKNKHGVPFYGLVITSILVTLLLLLTSSPDLIHQYKLIILIATLSSLISYFYTPIAEIILLKTKVFPFSKTAIIGASMAMIYAFWAIMGSGMEVLSYGALLILISIALFVFIADNKKSTISKN
jgi:basic amino acid/polyamine antiporter, APA family